jgi:hypothetical protein
MEHDGHNVRQTNQFRRESIGKDNKSNEWL